LHRHTIVQINTRVIGKTMASKVNLGSGMRAFRQGDPLSYTTRAPSDCSPAAERN
jgi:hypothetical protein